MKVVFTFFLILFTFLKLNAQEINNPLVKIDKASFGIGAGLNYGGIGANVLIYPHKNIALFAGGGFAFAGFGFNGGVKIRLISNQTTSKINPFATVMYGYNTAIIIDGAKELDKLFYGFSFGAGIDFNFAKKRKIGYWSIALLFPKRNEKVDEYLFNLRNYYNVKMKNSLSPVTFSIGYHFIIN